MVTEVSDIITGSDQFIKYSPLEILTLRVSQKSGTSRSGMQVWKEEKL